MGLLAWHSHWRPTRILSETIRKERTRSWSDPPTFTWVLCHTYTYTDVHTKRFLFLRKQSLPMTSILSLCQGSTNDCSDTCIYHFVSIDIFCLITNGAQPLDCRLCQIYHQMSTQTPNYLAESPHCGWGYGQHQIQPWNRFFKSKFLMDIFLSLPPVLNLLWQVLKEKIHIFKMCF